jgi:hypothetical protein
MKARMTRHGHNPRDGGSSATHRSWAHMIQRCNNPNNTMFRHYGGRGIVVCGRWEKFENFLADMGIRPEGTSLDRINVNGNYEPSNCRWATKSQQDRNRRDTFKVSYQGREISLAELSEELGVSRYTLRQRVLSGWSETRYADPSQVSKNHVSRRGGNCLPLA